MSKLGIDIDGVLADFNSAYIDLCIKIAGRDLFPARPFEIPCWSYPEFYGYTKEEVGKVWKHINEAEYFWQKLPAYPGTEGVMRQLYQARHSHAYYFITTRPGQSAKYQTEEWLEDRMYADSWGFDYFTPTVLISAKKGPIALGLDLDAFIDDKVENCVDVATYCGLGCKVYMLNQPWNRDFTDLRSIKRVDTVEQFLEEVL